VQGQFLEEGKPAGVVGCLLRPLRANVVEELMVGERNDEHLPGFRRGDHEIFVVLVRLGARPEVVDDPRRPVGIVGWAGAGAHAVDDEEELVHGVGSLGVGPPPTAMRANTAPIDCCAQEPALMRIP